MSDSHEACAAPVSRAPRVLRTSDAGGLRTKIARQAAATWRSGVVTLGLLIATLGLQACDQTQTVQRGYRGVGMLQLFDPGKEAAAADLHKIPEAEEPADLDSPTANEVFKNVKVLNDLSATEFSRLMQAMSTWIAPEEGCDFCHNPNKLESDEKYTKVVARRMIQMTRQINTDWKAHVAGTGVTCWTCHRGQAVPSGDWFADAGSHAANLAVGMPKQTRPFSNAGNSALPNDPLSAFLTKDSGARIQSASALVGGNNQVNTHSIKSAESTYSLMLYISKSLGVNCTYCHNTRALSRWEESTPQRATAWHGLQMVRSLNTDYLIPLTPLFPAVRLGPLGDGPKVGCETCHKGIYKPLYGVSPLKDYPVLAGVVMAAASAPAPAAAPPAPAKK